MDKEKMLKLLGELKTLSTKECTKAELDAIDDALWLLWKVM